MKERKEMKENGGSGDEIGNDRDDDESGGDESWDDEKERMGMKLEIVRKDVRKDVRK